MTESIPHAWPACPWPGWAKLYAQLIRDLRELDPALVVDDAGELGGATIALGSVTSNAGDRVFDRIDAAERLSAITCVVCGDLISVGARGWPPLCAAHDDATPTSPRPGWAVLYARLVADLRRIDRGVVITSACVFGEGELQVRVAPSDPQLETPLLARIAHAEDEAAETCELCGAPGQSRPIRPAGRIRCDEHAQEATP